MAILSGQPQSDNNDISNQTTHKLPVQTETPTPELEAGSWQASPILEEAIRIAKLYGFVMALCPLCLMDYEEKRGRFINLENTFPEFCRQHQKWGKEGDAQERYRKAHLMYTALKWYLLPPDYTWPELR